MGVGFFNYWKIGVPLAREKNVKNRNMGEEGSQDLNYMDENAPG